MPISNRRGVLHFASELRLAVLLAIRFTVLFAGLPSGVRSQHEAGDVAALTDPGAPVAPRLAGKAIWTTLISVAGFAARVAFADHAG